MPSLSLKASINYPFIGGPSGPSYDADAAAWFSAVESAGASISSANKDVFNNCILDLKGILPNSTLNPTGLNFWSGIRMAGFLCGFDNGSDSAYQGCFVPMAGRGSYSAINGGFTSSDYDKFNGLTGNETDKNIQTNITPTNIAAGATQRVLTIATTDFRDLYVTPSDQIQRFLIGTASASNQDFGFKRGTSTAPNPRFCFSENAGVQIITLPPVGNRVACYSGTRISSGGNGTIATFDYTTASSPAGAGAGAGALNSGINIFSRAASTGYYNGKIGYYSMASRATGGFNITSNFQAYNQIIKNAIDSLT